MKILLDNYRAFFFDFDGVIADSLDIKTHAFGELFKDYGRSVVKKVRAYHLANGAVSRYDKFNFFYKDILNKEITPKIMDDLDKRYSHLVVESVVRAPFIKGVMRFIRRLAEGNKDCFIISATPEKEIRRIAKLKKIDTLFKEIVGAPNKKSENLKYLLYKAKVKNEEAIYFGDAMGDCEAARENNVYFIGIVNRKSRELKYLNDIPKIRDFNHFRDFTVCQNLR